MSDQAQELTEAVRAAFDRSSGVHIRGGGSKGFLGNSCDATALPVAGHAGIVSYEPTELVITARAGTRLSTLREALAEQGQLLPFEPPSFGDAATLGGTLACGLSGPARPYRGAARDMVLGTRIINGKGEQLRFGGEVMKNVAGYDLSRLMVGAHGTLGVLLEASLKVLPAPSASITRLFELDQSTALDRLNEWAGRALPVSASAWLDGRLYLRLSGAESAVAKAAEDLGGETAANDGFWDRLANHQLDFFRPLTGAESLWRLSLPQAAPTLREDMLVEWGGGQRWLISDEPVDTVRQLAATYGGHATRFRAATARRDQVFHPPAPALMTIHRSLKQALDPRGIFNPGVFFAELQ